MKYGISLILNLMICLYTSRTSEVVHWLLDCKMHVEYMHKNEKL